MFKDDYTNSSKTNPMAAKQTATQKTITALSREILSGRYPADRPLPTEFELGERFGLSRMTIRNVLAQLEHQGLIYRRQGSGTFAHPIDQIPTRPIALLLRETQKVSSPYMTGLINGANAYLNSIGSHISLISTRPAEWTQPFIQSISGVMIIPTMVEREDITALKKTKLAYMTVMESDLPGPAIKMGVRKAASQLVEGLLGLGHRRFALISGHTRHADRQKHAGIEAALAEVGISFKDVPDFETNYDNEQALNAAVKIVTLIPRPTAVIAFDDTLAVRMISVAIRNGLSVPEDLSVVGFNDAPFSSLVEPSISTVRFPILEAGQRAAEALTRSCLEGASPSSITLAHEIIWRASTARPAHR
jgi:DNA-binding LacI/PurR family transcriptional regulator